jgi:hypothetical protein
MNGTIISALLFAAASASAANPEAGVDPPADAGVASESANLPFTAYSIKKILASHHQDLQNCYEQTLAGQEKVVEGKLTVAFSIQPDGTVKKAQVLKKGTTLHDTKLHDCVVSVLSGITFPKPPDHREHPVEYPVNLKAIR